MIHPDHEVLLQGRIDGTLTGDEREQLDRLLATDADVRARADELDRLADLVDSLGDVDPPSGLTQQILSAIAARGVRAPAHDIARIATFDTKASHAAHSGARMDGGTVMGKKVMWGLAAAAVIALAVLNYTGIVPPREGTEGTIGAAKRYQAPQIADKDVALGDTSAQAFIQSDLFDQMMHDGNVRQLLSNEATRAALKSAELRAVLATPGLAQALASPALRQALGSAELRAAISAPGFVAALGQPALSAALNAPGLAAALASPTFRVAVADPGFAQALSSPQLAAALTTPGVAAALGSQALSSALAKSSPSAVLDSPAFRELRATGLSQALSNAAFAKAFVNADFRALLATPGFASAARQRAAPRRPGSPRLRRGVGAAGAGRCPQQPRIRVCAVER